MRMRRDGPPLVVVKRSAACTDWMERCPKLRFIYTARKNYSVTLVQKKWSRFQGTTDLLKQPDSLLGVLFSDGSDGVFDSWLIGDGLAHRCGRKLLSAYLATDSCQSFQTNLLSFCNTRKEDTVYNRYWSHILVRLIWRIPLFWKKEMAPVCATRYTVITIKRILIDCTALVEIRIMLRKGLYIHCFKMLTQKEFLISLETLVYSIKYER